MTLASPDANEWVFLLQRETLAQDTTPPTIASVTSSGDPTKIVVVYSEPVDSASAISVLNYTVNNSITIQDASLGSDGKTVTLTTTAHTDGTPYILTVNNVQDKASAPNTIDPNTQASYTFRTAPAISNLTVSNGKIYEIVQNGLQPGALQYIDRTGTFTAIPAIVSGASYIKTANNDKLSTGNSFLFFDVNQPVTVYIAHDDRYLTKPSWLVSFSDTGQDLAGLGTLSLYAKDFPAGRITLGGNTADGTGDNSMYTVVVKPRSSATDTIPPASPRSLKTLP